MQRPRFRYLSIFWEFLVHFYEEVAGLNRRVRLCVQQQLQLVLTALILFRVMLLTLLLPTLITQAQSFQTSFVELKFDRLKSTNTTFSLFTVEKPTGYVHINLPLGPQVGAKGMGIVPCIEGINTFRKREGELHSGVIGYDQPTPITSINASTVEFNFLTFIDGYGISLPGGRSFQVRPDFSGQISSITVSNLLQNFGYSGAQVFSTNSNSGIRPPLIGPNGEIVVEIQDATGPIEICDGFQGIPSQPSSPSYRAITRKKLFLLKNLPTNFHITIIDIIFMNLISNYLLPSVDH